MIFLENLIFLAWKHQSVAYFIEKLVILWRCIKRYCITVKNLIFSTDTPNGSKLSLEKGYFMKIYNISKKHTERYRIQVKKLVFFSNFSKISKFPVISSNGIALQWKIWYFIWYLLKTWYFSETLWTGLYYSGEIRYFVENLIFSSDFSNISKMNNFPLKTTGSTRFNFKNIILVIFLINTPNGRRLSFENWLKSVISLKLAYFMKI